MRAVLGGVLAGGLLAVHAENLGNQIASAESGPYYLGCYLQKAVQAESMWGRFVAWKEGSR